MSMRALHRVALLGLFFLCSCGAMEEFTRSSGEVLVVAGDATKAAAPVVGATNPAAGAATGAIGTVLTTLGGSLGALALAIGAFNRRRAEKDVEERNANRKTETDELYDETAAVKERLAALEAKQPGQ